MWFACADGVSLIWIMDRYATYLAVTGIRHDLKGERALAEAAYDDLYHVITRLSGKTVRELAEG